MYNNKYTINQIKEHFLKNLPVRCICNCDKHSFKSGRSYGIFINSDLLQAKSVMIRNDYLNNQKRYSFKVNNRIITLDEFNKHFDLKTREERINELLEFIDKN